MSSACDFVIENGILKRYAGKGGDIVVPDGVSNRFAKGTYEGMARRLYKTERKIHLLVKSIVRYYKY